MGKKQKLRILCAEGDREALQPVLDALQARGVSVSEKADTLLAVLSERFYADETLKTALLEAVSAGGAGVLPLRLDRAEQPPEIRTALYVRNIIPADKRSPEQTAERIIAALPEKKNRMGAALIAGAAALAVLAGVLIWRSAPQEETAPETAPVMAEEITIPEGSGLRAEDLESIRSVVIIGDEARFLNSGSSQPNQGRLIVRDYAVDNGNGDGWFSKDDGHEYAMTRYDDLRFLALMPKLEVLSITLADIPELPDLSGTKLRRVELFNCTIDRLDWFDAEKLEEVTIMGCPVADYSPLSASAATMNAQFDFPDDAHPDLSGFHPKSIKWLTLSGNPREIKMPELSRCESLYRLTLLGLPIENLDFLRGADVYRLEISSFHRLRDVAGLAGMEHLSELEIQDCPQLRDYSPIGACANLEKLSIEAYDDNGLRDASFLEGLKFLQQIRLQGANLPDLNFLRGLGDKKREISFDFQGRCADLSALEAVKKYLSLSLKLYDAGFEAAAPYLQRAQINSLSLRGFRDLDLSLIPRDTMQLELTDCGIGPDLTGFSELYLSRLALQDIPALRSLKGLQNLKRFQELDKGALEIRGCPRLTDWSALDGLELESLELAGVYALPGFSKLRFHSLKLESLDWLEDLSCLDALDGSYKGYHIFSLPGMEQIRDLSPIARVIDSGGRLEVPPQLEEQARDLKQQGKIMQYDVVYPEGGWELDRSELSLLSLDELNTLPPALLRRVTTLAVAGGTVFDMDDYEIWTRWKNGRNEYVLVDRATREETPIDMGPIRELSAFSALTGLRRLILISQPIDSLAGLENMEKLQTLELKGCPKLADASPVFAVQSLETIRIEHMPVSSIQGVQNLYRLKELGINYSQVSDLSPLTECDFAEAEQVGGFDLSLDKIPCRDLSALSAIAHYRKLNVNNLDAALWREAIRGCRIEELECVGSGIDNAALEGLLSEHPELRRLCLSWTQGLTDLTPLLELDALEEVRVSRDMQAAIDSLNGKDLRFRLNIEG